jgi:hypothetical protein
MVVANNPAVCLSTNFEPDKMKQIVTKYQFFRVVNYSFNTGNIHSKIGQIVTDF